MDSPFIKPFKKETRGLGLDEGACLECKCETNSLFSWKTRGQFSLDHKKISALAELQKLRLTFEELKVWFNTEVAGKALRRAT